VALTAHPTWCIRHSNLGDGVTLHIGAPGVIEIKETADVDPHDLTLRTERIDRPGGTGLTVVTLAVDGGELIELPRLELSELYVALGRLAREVGAR
jgi:hypothetical protein